MARETGPRNATATIVAAPSAAAVNDTDSGRTSAWPGSRRRRAREDGKPSPQHVHGARTALDRDPVAQPDELAHERRGRRGVQLRRGGDLVEPAGVHDTHPVGDRQRLLLVVGDEEGGGADVDLDPADLVAQLHPDLGVEGGQRLVEQQHGGLDRERPGQRDPLLLATGELVGVAVLLGAETDQVEHVAGPRPALGARPAPQLEPEGHVVEHRQVGEQAVGLEDHPHVALVRGHPGEVLATDADRPGIRLLQAREDAERGGLAAARGPQEHDELTGVQVQVEPVEGVHVAVRPAQAGQLDGEPGGGAAGARGAVGSAVDIYFPSEGRRRRSRSESAASRRAANTSEARAAAIDSGALALLIRTITTGSVL